MEVFDMVIAFKQLCMVMIRCDNDKDMVQPVC